MGKTIDILFTIIIYCILNVRAKIITKSEEWGGGSRNRHELDGLGHEEALLGSIKGPTEVSFQKN